MVSITIVKLLEYFQDPILEALSDVADEAKNIFKNGVKPYLESINLRFSRIKTFLHRHQTIDFYQTYFPCTLVSSKNPRISTENIKRLFSNNSYLTVIGSAGSGKSMLMKHLFLSCVREKYLIPVFIELRHLNDYEDGLIAYINHLLLTNQISTNEKILKRILNSGKFLFLFDGYDEIFSEKKSTVTNEINSFVDLYRKNKFVITSRPGANIELLPRFNNFYVNKLSERDIRTFIWKQLEVYKKEDWEELAKRMIENIELPENKSYKFFLRNPLLLSMFILYYENNPSVPKKKSSFYSNVFSALCIQHNALSKQGFSHEKKSGLSNDQIEYILKAFSFFTYFKGEYLFDYNRLKTVLNQIEKDDKNGIKFESDFLIEDLTVSIPILIKDGTDYMFPHRSLQEYFAASFIFELSESQKQLLYKKKLKSLVSRGTDSYSNFWSLCLELDKKAFLQHFVINSLNEFLQSIRMGSEQETIYDILKLMGLELKIEFYRYLQHDHYSLKSAIKTDYSSGEIRNAVWSDEFDFYKNVFKFLGIFKIYELIENIDPQKIYACCSHKLTDKNVRIINDFEMANDTEDDREKELTELGEIELIYGEAVDKALDANVESSIVAYTIKFTELFTKVIEVVPLISETQLGEELMKLHHSVSAKIEDLDEELNKDLGFNDNLLSEILGE